MDRNSDVKPLDTDPSASATGGESAGVNAMRLSWPHLYLGALGFAISLYALRVHNLIASGGDAGCGFTETITCDKVLASPYAKFMGIPLGAFGMAYFVVVIMTGITTNTKTTDLQAAFWRLLVMSAGIIGSLSLIYISFVVIGAACPVCMATHAVVITLFVISLVQFLKIKRQSRLAEEPDEIADAG